MPISRPFTVTIFLEPDGISSARATMWRLIGQSS
jgi:hypothetical protein